MEDFIKFYDNYERVSGLISAIIPDIRERFKFSTIDYFREQQIEEFISILKVRFPSVVENLEKKLTLNPNTLLVNCVLVICKIYGESQNIEEYNDKIEKSIQQIKNILAKCSLIYDLTKEKGASEWRSEVRAFCSRLELECFLHLSKKFPDVPEDTFNFIWIDKKDYFKVENIVMPLLENYYEDGNEFWNELYQKLDSYFETTLIHYLKK